MTRNVIAVTTAAFVGFTGFTLVMPFLALYMRELGVTDTADAALWAGLCLGVTPLIAALCAPLWGRVGDRFGNKLLVQRSLLSFVVLMVLMACATRPWHLLGLRTLQGFVGGYGPLTLAMAAMSVPADQMARAIGTVQTAQRLAPALGPMIGALLAPLVGLRGAFLVSAVIYGAAFILMTVLYREPARHAERDEGARRITFATILAFENFLLLLLVIFGLQLVDRSFGPILALYLDQIGYPGREGTAMAGLLFSTLAASGALGNQFAARLLQRHSARVVIAGGVLGAAGALGLFALVERWRLLVPALALFGIGHGTAVTTAFTAAGSVIPRRAHSSGFGFLGGASLIASAVSPVMSGLLAARSIRLVFVFGIAALGLLALAVRRVMVQRDLTFEPAPAVDET